MKRPLPLLLVLTLAVAFWYTDRLRAFCGFYVARADTTLFNRASQVVIVRDSDRTVMTMANDFQGDLTEFAVVIPVPTFIQRGQIHIGDKALIDHLDAYSAPRLVEYVDRNPCEPEIRSAGAMPTAPAPMTLGSAKRADALGVKIEASYTVGEYDILILSATQSAGLETWLKENGYRVPHGASAVLGSYIKQDMHFFVAKVNLAEQKKTGYTYLRPIQVAYESPKFMLPIRLGMVNAKGPQELFVFALTRQGRIETTNYRTVKLPTGIEVPPFIKGEFASFYKAMFDEQVRREAMRAVFLEYAWDMNWCDPCAADPLSRDELRGLGVFWLDDAGPAPDGSRRPGGIRRPGPIPPQAQDVFVTRLHLRYDNAHFPDDLVFQYTGNRENVQGRYVVRHEWTGGDSCEAATRYRADLPQRREQLADALSSMTGWPLADVRKKMNLGAVQAPADASWWERLWPRQ